VSSSRTNTVWLKSVSPRPGSGSGFSTYGTLKEILLHLRQDFKIALRGPPGTINRLIQWGKWIANV
jgi:hypothetical protein